MTKMKKILAVGLAGLMAVGFAACSGSKDSTTPDDTKTDATATAKTGYAISSEIKDDEYNKSETALEIDSVCAAVLVDADGKIHFPNPDTDSSGASKKAATQPSDMT